MGNGYRAISLIRYKSHWLRWLKLLEPAHKHLKIAKALEVLPIVNSSAQVKMQDSED